MNKYDLIFHEAGIPPIHTPIEILQNLPEEVKSKTHLYHIALKDMPPDLSGLKRVELGLNSTYRLLEKLEKPRLINTVMENIELLSSLDIIKWIPFKRITDVIQCVQERSWK